MTSPFSSSLVSKLKAVTAWWFTGEVGDGRFTFRYFCCTDPNDLGLDPGKDPVAVINLSPNPTFPGDTVSFDGSDSYDPDGTVTGYSWTFPGQSPSSSSSASGTITAGSPGVYEVKLTVTDGTALRSAPATVTLIVSSRLDLASASSFLCTETGLYVSDDGGANWVSLNNGISIYDLETFDVAVDPATSRQPLGSKVIWRTGQGIVLASTDGGDTWYDVTPTTISNQWGDAQPPTPSDLMFDTIIFFNNRVFISGIQNTGSDYRSWILFTDDAKEFRSDPTTTVTWSEVTTSWDG